MYRKPMVPRLIGGVLDDTLQLFKASLPKCIVAAVLFSVISTALSLYQLSRQTTVVNPGASFQSVLANYQFTSPLTYLLMLFGLLLQLVYYGVLIAIIASVTRGAALSFGASIRATLNRLLAIIGGSIAVSIVSLVGFGIAAIPVIIAVVRTWGEPAIQIAAAILPMSLISLVLALPVIYVAARLQLFLVPLVAEGAGPLRAIAISWRLIGGNWWRTTTVVFILGIIVYVLMVVIAGVASFIAAMSAGVPTNPLRTAAVVSIVETVTAGLMQIISAPLLMSMQVTLYQDLQLRKGGGDLEARLGALPKA